MAKLQTETLLASEEMLAEIVRVLTYDHIQQRYGITEQIAEVYVTRIRETVTITHSVQATDPLVTADPSDDKFLLCALVGNADGIVSGDRHLRRIQEFEGIPIMQPAELLAFIEARST